MFVIVIKIFDKVCCAAVRYERTAAGIAATEGLDIGLKPLSPQAKSLFAAVMNGRDLPAFPANQWTRCVVNNANAITPQTPGPFPGWYNQNPPILRVSALLLGGGVALAIDWEVNVGRVYYSAYNET